MKRIQDSPLLYKRQVPLGKTAPRLYWEDHPPNASESSGDVQAATPATKLHSCSIYSHLQTRLEKLRPAINTEIDTKEAIDESLTDEEAHFAVDTLPPCSEPTTRTRNLC